MFSDNVWLDVALVGSILISWLALAVALLCYGRLRKQASLTQTLFQRLDHNLQVTNSGSIGMGKRLIELERRLSGGADSDVGGNSVAAEAFTPSFDPELADAARLLEAGLPADEVARRCGLSRAEASLMQLMHSQVKQAKAA